MLKLSFFPVTGAFCLLLYVPPVLAAPTPPNDCGDPAVNCEPMPTPQTVVVSATRIATPIGQVGSSVTVITTADIAAQQLRTVSDVLKLVPGLNVVQEGGPGGQTSIFMRGTNSNHTKVLIDGIDVSDPSNAGASFDFGQLLASDIVRIEVLRGPAKRTVRIRRHRRCHQHHHPLRHGAFQSFRQRRRWNLSHQQ